MTDKMLNIRFPLTSRSMILYDIKLL